MDKRLLIFLCAIVISANAGAQQQTAPAAKNLWLESAKVDSAVFPERLFEDTKDVFLRNDNIVALLLAGGASVMMNKNDIDERLAEHSRRHPSFGDLWDETFNIVGSPAFHFPAVAVWYAISTENQDDLNKQRSMTMLSALAINGAVTLGFKAVRSNDTPNGDSWAWPSGHTSSSFTVASVLHEFYGLKVGIPAYVLAGLVAYRMMDAGSHWASDIVFGATLGWVVGHTVAGKHKELEIAGFKVLPYAGNAGNPAIGVSLVKQF